MQENFLAMRGKDKRRNLLSENNVYNIISDLFTKEISIFTFLSVFYLYLYFIIKLRKRKELYCPPQVM